MEHKNTLIDHLPEIFKKLPATLEPDAAKPFIEKFLQLFQEQFDGFENKIDKIHHLLDPWKAEPEFLPWLASWLDLTLPEYWGERTRRALIEKMFFIYQKRGTLEGIRTVLEIYLGAAVQEIKEDPDTPHLFIVTVLFPKFEPRELARRTREIKDVINREKPAHTDFVWNVMSPTMQINFHSTVGVDTILGTAPNPDFSDN